MKFPSILFLLIFSASICSKVLSCEGSYMAIHAIQGQGKESAFIGQTVVVKGVVTGDFSKKSKLGGYFIQQQDADEDIKTSEGLFLQSNTIVDSLLVGDLVVVEGRVSENFEVTQLDSVSRIKVCAAKVELPSAYLLHLPLNGFDLEQVEGMRVGFNKPVVITDLYPYLKYGELVVSSELLMSPTAIYRPGKQIKTHRAYNDDNQLIIDDGSNLKSPDPYPVGSDGVNAINAHNSLVLGQQLDAVGVMHFAYGKYKLEPTESIKFTQPDLQTLPSDPGGHLRIANFNLENYFISIDEGEETCGPLQNFGCRGADSHAEYQRQVDKLVRAINLADASVVGLQELENNIDSTRTLVEALNNHAGNKKWAYVKTGVLGGDVIKVGLIYQPSKVQLVGDYALLDAKANPDFKANKNRVVVAQTFKTRNNSLFNMATAHLKSKSCRDAEGINLDQKDGQGCYNAVRTEVAHQLSEWLNNDPTGQGAEISILTGDLNSYQKEDPIFTLQNNGFTNLADQFLNPTNWTTSYRGQLGSLDYVLVNEAAAKVATGLVQWHINSIHPWEFGYDLESLDDQREKPKNFYQKDPYSSSDHDVVLAGFDL